MPAGDPGWPVAAGVVAARSTDRLQGPEVTEDVKTASQAMTELINKDFI